MKKLLTIVVWLMVIFTGCSTTTKSSKDGNTVDLRPTLEIFNNSYYDVRIYYDGRRIATVTSINSECVFLRTIMTERNLTISPIGMTRVFKTRYINFINYPGWILNITNDYSLSANLGLRAKRVSCK